MRARRREGDTTIGARGSRWGGHRWQHNVKKPAFLAARWGGRLFILTTRGAAGVPCLYAHRGRAREQSPSTTVFCARATLSTPPLDPATSGCCRTPPCAPSRQTRSERLRAGGPKALRHVATLGSGSSLPKRGSSIPLFHEAGSLEDLSPQPSRPSHHAVAPLGRGGTPGGTRRDRVQYLSQCMLPSAVDQGARRGWSVGSGGPTLRHPGAT